jgi:hypothetical protein
MKKHSILYGTICRTYPLPYALLRLFVLMAATDLWYLTESEFSPCRTGFIWPLRRRTTNIASNSPIITRTPIIKENDMHYILKYNGLLYEMKKMHWTMLKRFYFHNILLEPPLRKFLKSKFNLPFNWSSKWSNILTWLNVNMKILEVRICWWQKFSLTDNNTGYDATR